MDTITNNYQSSVQSAKPVTAASRRGLLSKSVNKRGAWKTSSIILSIIGVTLVATLLIGSASLMFVFFKYVRPESQTSAALTQASDTISDSDATVQTDSNSVITSETTSGKNFSITDAATLPDSGDKVALSTIAIASKVAPATVSILAEVSYGTIDGMQQTAEASGSGFIVSDDGYIVTNNHVIEGATAVSVVIAGEKDAVPAVVVGTDTSTDIAVLKIDRTGLPYVTIGDSDSLQVGELAVAIGNPFGELAGSVTVGVISALDREITIDSSTYNLLQTDASINSGNSGGPLVNSYGEVIGVTNAKVSEGEGIGFAIPINDISSVIEDLINNGYVTGRPVLGIGVVTVDSATAEQYGWPIGAYVRQVDAGSAAQSSGIEVGDIITKIDDADITSTEDVLDIKNAHQVGDSLTVTIYRNGDTLEVTLVLQEATA